MRKSHLLPKAHKKSNNNRKDKVLVKPFLLMDQQKKGQ